MFYVKLGTPMSKPCLKIKNTKPLHAKVSFTTMRQLV